MKISDLSQLLSRVQQTAGDLEVVFKAAEGDAETVITDLGIHLDPTSGETVGKLEIAHGTAPPAPEPKAETPAEGESAAGDDVSRRAEANASA